MATCNIPGAFMQVDMDELIHMRLAGPLASLLTKVNPGLYEKYVTQENGKPVIYVKLTKALYGTLQASLLFWKNLTKLNPYDQCVANKEIEGNQCTILWHVDDLKISHIDSKTVDMILDKLNEKYGTKEAPLTVTRGKVYDYLGMTLDFTEEGKVMIKMDDYVEGILEEARDDMSGESATPAADHLFTVNEEPDSEHMLLTEDSEYFHTMTAKLLLLSKRAQPDVQTPVAFLCTRVKAPDKDDYKKLAQVVNYLRGNPKLYLTLEADDTQIVTWWIDALFAVHKDMKSHTGDRPHRK
jgi:hypothetical protein